jgi:hypothetical protein
VREHNFRQNKFIHSQSYGGMQQIPDRVEKRESCRKRIEKKRCLVGYILVIKPDVVVNEFVL